MHQAPKGKARKGWLAVAVAAFGLAILLAAAGHGFAPGDGFYPLPPRFDLPSQRIRYHSGFHDSHSHDGYGHGYHGGNSGHVHFGQGQALHPLYPTAHILSDGSHPATVPGAQSDQDTEAAPDTVLFDLYLILDIGAEGALSEGP